uniref:Uncharacterized protein n=1 Tax=uncultured marine virus TaxID=186617 RepID=A0A0F7L597_9VIRU|nr:hypothetical protein [uncultured marine virus]
MRRPGHPDSLLDIPALARCGHGHALYPGELAILLERDHAARHEEMPRGLHEDGDELLRLLAGYVLRIESLQVFQPGRA